MDPQDDPTKPPAEDWKSWAVAPPKDTRETTADVAPRRGKDFAEMGLSQELQIGIYEMGYERPSPVQEQAIPHILVGSDVVARAKNGTGKTAAYVIPAIELIDHKKKQIQVLIIVPARELTYQVSALVKDIGKHCGTRTLATVGGMNIDTDLRTLISDPPHVLVTTPGRAVDILRTSTRPLDLSHVQLVCLDEADKLVSPDFQHSVVQLIRACPRDRQIVLFSATFPVHVGEFVKAVMTHPVKTVNVMETLTLVGITQYLVLLTEDTKLRSLKALLRTLRINQSIIFCNTVTRVELLARKIHGYGFPCYYIHSRMEQGDRNRVFDLFRKGQARHLVCTDVFSRGIDVQAVNVVINFDFPHSTETYLHRIGRSGRFGHFGLAINFATKEDLQTLTEVEQQLDTRMQPLPEDEIPPRLYAFPG